MPRSSRAAAAELWSAEAERELAEMQGVVVADVDARPILEGLVDIGLLRPPASKSERDELEALRVENERLKTRLSEFAA